MANEVLDEIVNLVMSLEYPYRVAFVIGVSLAGAIWNLIGFGIYKAIKTIVKHFKKNV